MLQAQSQPRPRQRPAATCANRRFGRYRTEKEQAIRIPEVKENATLRQLKDAFRRYLDGGHRDALPLISGINYTAEDIELFSIALAGFQGGPKFDYRAGYFLSALINNGSETDYRVHIMYSIRFLGHKNTKNIIVDGNVESYLGDLMQGGRIVVNGNAEACLGAGMSAGDIIINGDFDKLGDNIRGGNIYCKGIKIVENGRLV